MLQEVGVRSIPDLQKFGKDLKLFSEQLSTSFHMTERKMHAVCEGWNDQVNMKFIELFQQDTKVIDQIAARMSEYSQFISRSCEILNMYQHNRIK